MSQKQLGAAAELDRTYVSRVERGEHNVTLLTLARLAGALQVPLVALVSPSGHPTERR
jgi:transcriptional regulator with XRE-family HTH domain